MPGDAHLLLVNDSVSIFKVGKKTANNLRSMRLEAAINLILRDSDKNHPIIII